LLGKGEPGRIKAWTSTMVSAALLPGNRLFVDPDVMGPDWGIPGDIGFVDDDGFLTIVDRESDMIVRGGVNVAPQELEKLLRGHPKIRDVAVAGFPDDTMGQEIAAFIVAEHGTVEEFRAFLRANVAPDRRPREIRLVASLPYSDNGKLLRRRLVETLSTKI
jgi:long-chain acyl-CoA synthetase